MARLTGCGKSGSRTEPPPSQKTLVAIKTNTLAAETVLNSRRSYHSFGGVLPDQVLSNVLWATGKAPLVGASRSIYVGLPAGVYSYDPAKHDISLHLSGNHLSISKVGFEVGVISDVMEDAGVACQFGLLAATAFWSGTANQPACCPRGDATDNASSGWNAGTFTFAASYGLQGTVSGATTELAAASSDASLPDPATTSAVLFEDAVASMDYGATFGSQEPGLAQLSQIAWASYGNSPHTTNNGKAGLTAPSSYGSYYLGGRIYIVRSAGTERYHNRLPGGDKATRDHRLERLTAGDRRALLRSTLGRLPQTAPVYFVYCATETGSEPRLEAGLAGAGATLQASTLGLRGHLTAGFSDAERTSIIGALGLPASDLPLLVASFGPAPV